MDPEITEEVVPLKKKNRRRGYVASIMPDIDKLNIDIPEDVKIEAERQSVSNIHARSVRKKKKRYNIANSLYVAYHNKGYVKDPSELGKVLGLSKGEILKAINSSDDDSIVFHFPHHYIPGYVKHLEEVDTEMMSKNIVEFAKKLYKMNSTLLHEQPQNVAAAIIVFYTDYSGFNIENKNLYYKNIDKSPTKIASICRMISQIYNE